MKSRKIFVMIIPVLLLFAALIFAPCRSMAAGDHPTSGVVGTCKWTFNKSTGLLQITCKTSGVDGVMPDFEIWNAEEIYDVDTHQWIPSDLPWIYFREDIRRIVIESGVTYIGAQAFVEVGSKERPVTVSLPSYTTKEFVIGGNAFWHSYLQSVNLYYVTVIKYGAFEDTVFTNKSVPLGAREIEKRAFKNSNIRKVTFSEKVETIGEEAFSSCAGLEEVTLGTGVKTIGEKAFFGFRGNRKDYPTDAIYVGENVESIGRQAIGYYQDGSSETSDWNLLILTEEGSAAEQYAKSNNLNYQYGQLFFSNHDYADWVYDKNSNTLSMNCDNSAWRKQFTDEELDAMDFPTPGPSDPYWTSFVDKWGAEVYHVKFNDASRPYAHAGFTEISDGMTMLKNLQDVMVDDNGPGIAGVRKIAPGAFRGLSDLKEVMLNDLLKQIGAQAFEGCSALSQVTFGEGLEEIEEQAFARCFSLKEISLNPKLKKIGDGAFMSCGFETLTIGEIAEGETYHPETDKVQFGKDVFASCSRLISVSLGPKFTDVPEGMFEDCTSLQKVHYSNQLTAIGDRAFRKCIRLAVPTFSYQLKNIGAEAYAGTGVNAIYIPEWIEEIGDAAFGFDCINDAALLKEDAILYVPEDSAALNYAVNNNVPYEVNIGGADGNCNWRYNPETKELNVSGVGEMPAYTYQNMAPWTAYSNEIESIIIGDGITAVSRQAFYAESGEYANLEKVVLGRSIESVAAKAFYGPPVKEIEVPASVQTIASKAFGYYRDVYGKEKVREDLVMYVEPGSAAETYAEENGIDHSSTRFSGTAGDVNYAFDRHTGTLTISGDGAMEDYLSYHDTPWYEFRKVVKTLHILEGVTSIGDRSFMCFENLTKVFTPETLTKIGTHAFDGANRFGEIYIPSSVTSIGDFALGYKTLNPDGDSTAGGRWVSSRMTLYSESPDGPAFEYEENSRGPVAVHGRCGAVGECFYTINYEDGELVISGDGSFESEIYPWDEFYDKVQTIYLDPGSVIREIPEYAFSNLPNLTYASLNPYWGYVERIGKGAFLDDTALKSFEFPERVTEVEEETFRECAVLNSVSLRNVRKIGRRAFEGCGFLTGLSLNNNLMEIGERAFAVSGVETITTDTMEQGFPASVKKIGAEAFYEACLEEVEVPSTVKEIGDYAFGFTGMPDGPQKLENFVLWAPAGSKAQKYAQKNGLDWRDPYVGDIGEIHWEYQPAGKVLAVSGNGKIPADADAWKRFKNKISRIEIGNGVTEIGDRAFAGLCEGYNVENPAELKLAGSVVKIGASAFEDTWLGNVKLPIGVETVGEGAFRSTDLSGLTISRTVKTIGAYAFCGTWRSYDSGMKSVTIPPNVTSIGEYAFGFIPGNGYMLMDGFTVTGVAGSKAEAYAGSHEIPFTACTEEEIFPPCSKHKLIYVDEIVPTETSTGRMGFYACEECGEWYMDEEGTILIEDHTSIIIPADVPEVPEPPAPKLNYTKKTLKAGKTVTLKVTNGKVKSFKSSKTSVAKVTGKGVVTALKKGSATITVTLTTGKKLTCKITVSTSPAITVGGKKFKASTTYKVKKGKYLTVKITGRASSVANVYSTSKKTIAKVTTASKKTSTVKIKGLKKGSATVTIKVNGVAFKIKVKVT